jgi:hypothetical protein
VIAVALLFSLGPINAPAQVTIRRGGSLDDNQIRLRIVEQGVTAYLATGHLCACPYNSAQDGSSCRARSSYSRLGGASPLSPVKVGEEDATAALEVGSDYCATFEFMAERRFRVTCRRHCCAGTA